MQRRRFVAGLAMASLGWQTHAMSLQTSFSFMFEEGVRHKRTWMAFVADPELWGMALAPQVKANLALLANTIAKYEPVAILVSADDLALAKALLNVDSFPYAIELIECDVDDFWLRDSGPTFVWGGGGVRALDFNFNGWGGKQRHERDALVAQFIAQHAKVPLVATWPVLEGGCFEVDGEGTAILTKSCVLNDNRNPGTSQTAIERELSYRLGAHKIIWLEGIKGRDITDGHTDFYARFSQPGQVLVSRDNDQSSYDYAVTRENIEILRNSTDARGRPLRLTILDTPEVINEQYGVQNFAAGYIGYYVCNGAVIAQKFGDRRTDAKAKQKLQAAYPQHVIEQISVDAIASGGGSIHCATQQEIMAPTGAEIS